MNTHPTTTFGIWAFILAVFVLIAFLTLGSELADSSWLNTDLAAAQAEQISSQTLINQKYADLEYEQKKFHAEVEREQTLALAAQEIENKAAENAQARAFEKNIHAALVFGVRAVAFFLALGLGVASILGGIGLHRRLSAIAQTQPKQPSTGRLMVKIDQLERQAHAQQEIIASLKRQERRPPLPEVQNSFRIWPPTIENRKSRKPAPRAGD